MSADTLDQHRRELDATFAALKTIRDHATAEHALDRVVLARLDTLDAAVAALGNRVEALTRALALDGREHAIRVEGGDLLDELVVVNLEAEIPGVVGTYLTTVEDSVRYLDPTGRLGYAAADCVRILTRRELRETRRQAGRS